MKSLLPRVLLSTATALLALACGSRSSGETTPEEGSSEMTPPMAKRLPHPLTNHGETRDDPYYWMRSDDRSDPEALAYLEQENAYANEVLAPLDGFRQSLYDEIVARIPQDDTSVPYFKDGFWYYGRVEAGKEYGISCRRPGERGTFPEGATEEVILDQNERADGQSYYRLGGLSVSDDGTQMAIGEDTVSRRLYTLRFKNLATGEFYPEEIPNTSGGAVFAADNRTVFYIKKDLETLREYQVWRHVIGTDPSEDAMVFEETNDEFYMGLSRSRSRDYIFIGSYQTLSHEYQAIDARNPTAEPVVILPREENHEYDVDHAGGRFYIRTNWEARDFRLMSVEPGQSQDKSNWREEVPARESVLLDDFELFEQYLVIVERREGIRRLRVRPFASPENEHEIEFEDPVYVSGLGRNADFESTTLRMTYESMRRPESIYDYDMGSRERTLLKQEEVVGGFDPEAYVTERVMAQAHDGTQVPVSLVYRADLDRSQPNPLFLYGYGSYGISIDPSFSSSRFSLIDRGVIYAIAHIRGGQEMGRAWYENGKLLNKMNTFTDFIECAESLIQSGYTQSDRLFAYGGSAGGLLMGAVVNLRPDLFQAVVADVPFVDVVTTMLDESIPLTTFEYDEWGNPNDETYFRYMMSYSPYDNVAAQDYPAMLVLTGLHDSQVQYWEPAKWVARLRYRGTGSEPLLFITNMDAGHGGASGRFRRHEETARVYSFLLDQIDIHQ